jgi:hypothetical protein
MLRAILVMVFALLSFNSAYAERVSIVQQGIRDQHNGTFVYLATIVDHTLNVANICQVVVKSKPPTPATAYCSPRTYHSKLPAGANVNSVFEPPGPPLAGGVLEGVWEADQSSGAIQFCTFDTITPLDPCTLIQLVH